MSPRKNPHAVALGRRGGNANTPAQQAARSRNGKNGGRPMIYRLSARGHVERLADGEYVRVEPLDNAARAWLLRRRKAEAA